MYKKQGSDHSKKKLLMHAIMILIYLKYSEYWYNENVHYESKAKEAHGPHCSPEKNISSNKAMIIPAHY